MGIDQLGADEQTFAEGLIHLKACQLVKHRAVRSSDHEDLTQELWLHLLKRLPRYDASKGSLFAYITTVVERRVRSILRYHNVRIAGCCDSLNESVSFADGMSTDRYATLGSESPHRPRRETQEQRLLELRQDIEQVVSQLPADQQDLSRRLMTDSATQVSRDLEMPRGTLYGRMRKIRDKFQEGDIQDYL